MRKVFKIAAYIIASILVLILAVLFYLQTNHGQKFITKQVREYAYKNIHEDIEIGAIKYKFFSKISIQDLKVPTEDGGHLLTLGELDITFSIWGLLQNKLTVNSLYLSDVDAKITRASTDTTFNFNYIIEGFTAEENDREIVVKKKDEKESKPFNLTVKKVDLDNIKFSFLDTAGGSFFEMELAALKITPKIIDLSNNIFEVNELSIEGLQSYFDTDTSYLPPKPEDTTAALGLKLIVGDLKFEEVQFSMLSHIDSMYMNYEIGLAEMSDIDFDLLEELIDVDKIFLEEVSSVITFANKVAEKPSLPEIKEEDEVVSSSGNDWIITANQIRLNKVDFKMDDPLTPKLAQGMDYSHMHYQNTFIHLEDIYYHLDSISGKIQHIALKEQSGLNILELRSDFKYTNKTAGLWNLYLQTPQTLLEDKLIIGYESLDALINDNGSMLMDISLPNAKIAMSDVLLFLPESLANEYRVYDGQHFTLNTVMKGKLNDLSIATFKLNGLQDTYIDINGKIKGMPDVDRMAYHFNITELKSSAKDVDGFLTAEVREMLSLPEKFSLTGDVHGGIYHYFPNLALTSTDGHAVIRGSLDMRTTDHEKYDLFVTTDDLNLGRIMKMNDSTLGRITIEATAKGQSFNPKTLTAEVEAKVLAAQAMGYNYHDIVINSIIEKGVGDFIMKSSDPNLNIDADGRLDLREEYPSVAAKMNMRNVNLMALHFMTDTFNFQGQLVADFPSLNPDYPSGSLSITDGRLQIPGSITPFDSINIFSKPEDSIQNVYVNAANVIFAKLTGKVPLTSVGTALMSHIDRHYHLGDTTLVGEAMPYNMDLDGFITYHPVLNKFIPKLRPFDSISFQAIMDPDHLMLDMNIPQIFVGANVIDSGYVRIKENKDTFNFAVGLKQYENGPVRMYSPSVRGVIRNDSIYTLVNIKDSAQENQFTLGGSIHQDLSSDSSLTFIKLFSGLRFDYERWEVNPSNQIVMSPQGLLFRNLNISKGQESLSVQSQGAHYGSPFQILIKNFELANITKMLSDDTLLAEGALNVNGTIDMQDSYVKVEANAGIQNLKAFSYPLGNLTATVNNPTETEFATTLNLKGEGNDIDVKGSYYTEAKNGNEIDFKVLFNPFSLRSVEGLTFGALKNSTGGLLGDVRVQGKVSDPKFNGYLEFFAMNTTVSMLSASFRFGDDRILFDKDVLKFDNVRIYDYKDKEAKLNGTLKIKSFDEMIANLTFRANQWQPIHSTKADNQEFYGDLVLSSNLSINGDIMAPNVGGSITIHDSTKFTYVMLDTGPGMVDHTGIVQFYDSRDTLVFHHDADRPRRVARSSSVNVNVDIQKHARLGMVVDPGTGEGLEVKGTANLNTFINPDGSIGLTGVYKLEDGFYELKFNFLTRKFVIQKGSTITLSGDPMEAEASIVAIYKAEIAPYDLVEKQVSQEDLNFYKQRIPFQVLLKIDGKALEPELTFDIVIPEGTASGVSSNVESLVQSKLSELRTNPSEMNKQVFAVLLLNRFIAENPFATSTGNMEVVAKQTVGRFLSDQLNQYTNDLISGLELNVDLDATEDYSTGVKQSRTDLNVSASKRLFNDRVKVTVGNNFELEGAGQKEDRSVIPGNLAIDYDLSRDGKYQLRAYRTNELRNILDGYTIETGLNFRVALEYNRFKYIFINRQKQLERLRARREAERLKREEESEKEEQNNSTSTHVDQKVIRNDAD